MRLVCPNCDAEYQVDDAAVPESGRDVQCSNCGHAWFQLHTDAETAQNAEQALFGDAQNTGMTPAAEIAEPEPVAQTAADTPDSVSRQTGSRQTLAESVLSVLREEAERETAVRRDEDPISRPGDAGGSIEVQPDLGLEVAARASTPSPAARHIAQPIGAESDTVLQNETEAEPKTAARRDLLPDIEEINSTLRANSERAEEDDAEIDALPNLRQRRHAFRSGFVLMMAAAVVLSMGYVMAPKIIAQIPQSAPSMRAYVAAVDTGRLWLDKALKSASGSLRNVAGNGN